MAVRNDQIFELLQKMHLDMGDMKTDLAKMNGRLGAVEEVVHKLPCASHGVDLTILKERVGGQRVNWNRVINIGLGIGQAVLIVWVVSRLGS